MLAIPLFGPGYGPQYLFWSIPLLATVYYATDDIAMKRLLLVAYEIAAMTYIIEYGFFPSHGALALQEWPGAITLVLYADNISTKGGETLVRLPLFLALLVVFVKIARETKKLVTSTK
jgi:tRNA A37 threonylcarbamoyladenosine synthetase subunit TsaC/SUA5/YrdC